ncbi:MAG TPA: glutamine-hydrolyzing GMP synthase [Ktedonobacterales bacterium]
MPATSQTTDPGLTLTSGDHPSAAREMIAILDFGSQYSRLIARRVRECHVYCELLPATTTLDDLRKRNTRGVILSGGPDSVYDAGARSVQQDILESDLPVLGICYGMHLLAHQLGGQVEQHVGRREYGPAEISLSGAASGGAMGSADRAPETLFAGVEDATGAGIPVWMSHGDSVSELPPGFEVIARSSSGALAAMGDTHGHIGIQFHPEVSHTPQGAQMLENFLYRVCGLAPNWTTGTFIEEAVTRIRAQVGETGRVICGLSGGVDSAVAALLVHKAIGDRLTCIFVDTGCMRAGEADQVVETFRANLHIPLIAVDASDRFLAKLAGVTDPEQKRRIIGEEFVRVFEGEATKLQQEGEIGFLAQGTLYPDVIESASAHDANAAQTIKTHHNVGGLPEGMKFALVEPLRYLFKDEVRETGRELGLPEDWVWRHPFPGPGLAIRVIGEVTREKLDVLRKVDAIFIEELRRAELYREIGQAFAVLTPIQSVGVAGDLRTYANTVALRAVTTGDFMTANWARLPYDLLGYVANRIVNEVKQVNRVVYDITSKPPATIEWE